MKVYCWHEPLDSMHGPCGYQAVLELWQKSWSAFGWQPQILTSKDATPHRLYTFLKQRIEKLPTVNNKEYTVNNFLRWCALAVVGGGLLTDSDVINYGIRPDMVPTTSQSSFIGSFSYHAKKVLTPGIVLANRSGADRLVLHLLGFRMSEDCTHNGQPHCSDMVALRRVKPDVYIPYCVECNHPNAKKAFAVHFPNGLIPNGQNRAEYIRNFRAMPP